MFILWSHISQFYYRDMECGLKMLTKLTNDHMNLTPYSVMSAPRCSSFESNCWYFGTLVHQKLQVQPNFAL